MGTKRTAGVQTLEQCIAVYLGRISFQLTKIHTVEPGRDHSETQNYCSLRLHVFGLKL